MPGPQERLEASRTGRVLISALVISLVGAVAIWNLPDCAIKRTTIGAVRPVLVAAGLDQFWSVFAPDLRRHTIDITARIDYADGSQETWEFPSAREPVVSPFRSYHWQKLEEAVSAGKADVVRPFAAWVARTHERPRRPVQVTLIRVTQDLAAPGAGPDREPEEEAIFSLRVTPEVLQGTPPQ